MSKKKLPEYTSKSWNSLNELKDRIEKDGIEHVTYFDGAKLITNRRSFGLYLRTLTVSEINS